ncbi:2-succinyl-5-enolpyruvyl-6-hydroxy-3-cyclohexene-1-carboxylate synthase [Nitritalea halalkaliphila LW7]|uniref:2-succinyl-5-enolpyruvyl-6-hydroxy-3-cyclohexene-1-carboxylate synthase n=1 Tax=Nitritalea halalkaliphila LW7 TaxID=1189621 RepID=I5BTA1_9BACT|nr:2-succinyl-5-enolpyruvyl-6-hydroxy-3-cyclohexene-1-carboxylic-acid synthase [Nitritalea halalkaliphila]EIM72803.1 2-succinyl-5-enolpyruvyl-6-hydroxy-3-cyclohexene-1-carboxylate synthase [Nitritalea halalkaliphila LW7]
MNLQPIADLVSLCAAKGVKDAILSPGSRCAPLSLAFVRHPDIHTRTLSDERSAAFVALGIALETRRPVVLVCTSGSAAYNYAPAVAEAYFQQLPLLILTADRPPEWIDQWDGQTIHQQNLYGSHVKAAFQFPDSFSHPDQHWYGRRQVTEALTLAKAFPPGPVHINVPLREPFYPDAAHPFHFQAPKVPAQSLRGQLDLCAEDRERLKGTLQDAKRVLIVPGQQSPSPVLAGLLEEIAASRKALVVADSISNMQVPHALTLQDHFMGELPAEEAPDLLITFGKSLISKKLKLFLRAAACPHWHVQEAGYVPDTFQALQMHVPCHPAAFLRFFSAQRSPQPEETFSAWRALEAHYLEKIQADFVQRPFGEWTAIQRTLQRLPRGAKVHAANSMAVRYVNMCGRIAAEVYCNRGTSGIDGSSSTAVGAAFSTKDTVLLVTGDLAFFYDRNAFWHNYPMPNLRILLLNNHGGEIFRKIKGPSEQPELEEYFVTKQRLNARLLCEEFGFQYLLVHDKEALEEALTLFFQPSFKPKLIEVLV